MSEFNETTVEDFEKEQKKSIFDRVDYLCSSQRKLLSKIKTAEEVLDLNPEEELPNIGITFNNKLIELLHVFEDAGISMFSQKFENYGPKKLNFVSSSFLGDCVICYMLNNVSQGIDILSKYQSKLNELIDAEQEKYTALENANIFKKISFSIRSLVSFPEELYFSYTDDDVDELNSYIAEYLKIDNQLWTSSLRSIVIPSLVTQIKGHRYSKESVSGLLDEFLISDLEKLGLSDLIPELKREISTLFEQNSDCHSNKKSQKPSVGLER